MSTGPPDFHISKVILENFKSYAGVVEIGPFRPTFTAIVGPNGCGKSNLLEALLFVFGKKASKLRNQRLSDLITHNSLDPPSRAKVEIHFRHTSGDVTVLSRTIDTSNKSTYHLNSLELSSRAASERLKAMGIDLEQERFMIMQGEVEMISGMKGKGGYPEEMGRKGQEGLLEYFENLIGTVGFHYRMKDANKQIDELCFRLPSLRDLLRMNKRQKKRLKTRAIACYHFYKLQLDLLKLTNLSTQITEHITKESLIEAEHETESLRKEIESIDIEIVTNKEKRKLFLTKIQNVTEELAFYRRNRDEENEKRNASKDISGLKSMKIGLQSRFFQTQSTLNSLKLQFQTSSDTLQTLETAFKANESALTSKETDKKRLSSLLLSFESAQISPRQPFLSQLSYFTREKQRCESEYFLCESHLNEKLAALETCRAADDADKADRSSLQTRQISLNSDISHLATLCEVQQFELNSVSSRKAALAQLSASLNQSLMAVDRQIAESVSAKMSQIYALRKEENRTVIRCRLQNAISLGVLPGVLGRLGDLAAINPIYDVAISTVFAAKLNSYVALTVEAAERLIEYCRCERLGRITVLVLQTIPDYAIDSHFRAVYYRAVRLFDEIQVDQFMPEVRRAVYHVVRDTLVVDSIEEARKVAFWGEIRHTVVTKRGEVVRPTGEMQGFERELRGGMRTVGGVARDIQKNNSAGEMVDSLMRKKRDLEAGIGRNDEQMGSSRLDCEKIIGKIDSLRMEIEFKRREITVLSGELEKPIRNEEEFATEIAALNSECETAEKAVILAKNQLETANCAVENAKHNLNSLKSSEEIALNQSISNITTEIRKIEEFGDSILRKKTVSKLKVTNLSKEIEETEGKIKNLTVNLHEIEINIEKAEFQSVEIDRKIADINRKITEMKNELDSISEKERKIYENIEYLSNKRNALNSKFREMSKIITEIRAKIANFSQQIAKIKLENTEKSSDFRQYFHYFLRNPKKYAYPKRYFHSNSKYLCEISEEINIDSYRSKSNSFEGTLREIEEWQGVIRRELEGNRDFGVVGEFNEAVRRVEDGEKEIGEVLGTLGERREQYDTLRKERLDAFQRGFDHISRQFKIYYSLLTATGDAELEFIDPADPFSEGLKITVRPPGKTWKQMSVLSGGERTVVSLALIFSLHEYKPNAIYLMDEIDAALDFVNLQQVGELVRRKGKEAQFIVVSLRGQMFEKAEQLVGVYKPGSFSHSISIHPFPIYP